MGGGLTQTRDSEQPKNFSGFKSHRQGQPTTANSGAAGRTALAARPGRPEPAGITLVASENRPESRQKPSGQAPPTLQASPRPGWAAPGPGVMLTGTQGHSRPSPAAGSPTLPQSHTQACSCQGCPRKSIQESLRLAPNSVQVMTKTGTALLLKS